jgi:integrase
VRQNQERLALGPAWDICRDLVFPNTVGRPIQGIDLLNRSLYPLLKRAGLRRIRFHDLRHTAATLLLKQNVHPKVVSEILGHSSMAITLDRYSHVTMDLQSEAAMAMERALGGVI